MIHNAEQFPEEASFTKLERDGCGKAWEANTARRKSKRRRADIAVALLTTDNGLLERSSSPPTAGPSFPFWLHRR